MKGFDMRKECKLEAGWYRRRWGCAEMEFHAQPVRVIRVHDEDEDEFVFSTLGDNLEFVAPGHAFNPHPMAPETNVEMITRLMEWAKTGPLVQMFVIDALEKHAALVLGASEEQRATFKNGLVSYEAWAAAAREVQQTIAAHAEAVR